MEQMAFNWETNRAHIRIITPGTQVNSRVSLSDQSTVFTGTSSLVECIFGRN